MQWNSIWSVNCNQPLVQFAWSSNICLLVIAPIQSSIKSIFSSLEFWWKNLKIQIELNSLQLTKANTQVFFGRDARLHWLKLVDRINNSTNKSNYEYDYDGYFHALFVCSHILLIFQQHLHARIIKSNKWFNCRQMSNICESKLITTLGSPVRNCYDTYHNCSVRKE